ncbi:hypothetical protein DFP73DRAFT_529870 [Morchella snyderi]|nr:hypothetical protein DFP73DRAFT_529870 [Morchella snyderi]
MEPLPTSLRALEFEEVNLVFQNHTERPSTTPPTAQVADHSNAQTTTALQDTMHTTAPSTGGSPSTQDGTPQALCTTTTFGGSHSTPVASGGGGDSDGDNDGDVELPDHSDPSNSDATGSDSEDDSDEDGGSPHICIGCCLHTRGVQHTIQQEVDLLNEMFEEYPVGSRHRRHAGICTNCGRITTTDGTAPNNNHNPGECAPAATSDIEDHLDDEQDESDDGDEEEEEEEDDTAMTDLDSHDYAEPCHESEASDAEPDDTRLVCTICARRLAVICLTPCSHFFCTSCVLNIWWSGVRYPHHWPLFLPCPICRHAVEDVIDEGGVVIDLLWWVLLVSRRAQQRAMLEDPDMIVSAHAQALVRNMEIVLRGKGNSYDFE